MDASYHTIWWLYALRACLALVVGMVAVSNPNHVLGEPSTYLGIYLLLESLLNFVSAGTRFRRQGWLLQTCLGLMLLVIGVSLYYQPLQPVPRQLWLYALGVFLLGVHNLIVGQWIRASVSISNWLILAGSSAAVLSVLEGVLAPRLDHVLSITIGVQLFSYSVCLFAIALALRMRKRIHRLYHAT